MRIAGLMDENGLIGSAEATGTARSIPEGRTHSYLVYDGTAKGGVLVAIAEAYALPIHFVGVGEKAEDLQPFSAEAYAKALVGLDTYNSAET